MNQQTRNILFMVSSIAVIIGAAMPLFMLKMPWVPYIYAFGAAGRLDYVAYCRCCPTIIYIDSHSASIQERRKISYSQPLPCRAP